MISLQILAIFGFTIIIPCYSTPPSRPDSKEVCSLSEQFAACTLGDYIPHVAQLKDAQKLQELEQKARKFADNIGFHHETKKKGWISEPISPFTLLPSRIPRKLFDQAMELQPLMNLLYFHASTDIEFLREALGEAAKSDKLIGTMMAIIEEVHAEGGYKRQPIVLDWQRSDYMLHMNKPGNEDYEIKQIEVNAAAAGGHPMANWMTKIHRYTLSQLGMDASLEVLHDNKIEILVEGRYMAWLAFGDPNAVVLTITHRVGKTNPMFSSKAFKNQQDLFDRVSGNKMKFVFMGLEQCDDELELDSDFTLRLKKDGRPVALADYRVAPFPRVELITEKVTRVMRMIERSTAIKSPTIGYHLMNLKKVQQVLAKPGMVERFFTGPAEAKFAAEIRKTFAGLWGLDSDDKVTKDAIENAIAHPENYVLKPSKEGGRNNYYGQQIVEKLKKFGPAERATHILMEKVNPPIFENYIIEPHAVPRENPLPRYGKMTTEFSVYGMLVANRVDGTVVYNQAGGYMMRTKWAHTDEGGILNGLGFYDSPYLY